MPPRKSPDTLTVREARFVAEYIVDYNGTQAAIRAGYSPRSAGITANEVLKRPIVQAELEKAKAAHLARTHVTADRVLQELGRIATQNPSSYLTVTADGHLVPDFSRMTPDDFAAVSALEFELVKPERGAKVAKKGKAARTHGPPGVHAALPRHVVSKIKMWDKGAALALLGRHFGLLAADQTPPPPDPAAHDRRLTTVRVLIGSLDAKASQRHAVAVQVEDGPATGALRQMQASRGPVLSGKPPK